MNKSTIMLVGLLLWSLGTVAAADDLDQLFVAETPVADEGSATRNQALATLLAEVLVRVSGNPDIVSQADGKALLDAAPSLVRQYQYRSEEQGGETIRLLNARFDRGSTERMMRERNLPVWTRRPQVLLWLATERSGKRNLFNLEQNPETRAMLLERAQQLGMPLQLPLMDLEDQAQLTPADLWSDYRPGIELASARYPYQVILTGRLTAAGKQRWKGSWSLIDGDQITGFRTASASTDGTLESAVGQAQKLLAARYAPIPAQAGAEGTLVLFSNVDQLADYGRLNALLNTLDMISPPVLRAASGSDLLYEMQLQGSERQLQRALEQSGMLVAQPPPIGNAEGGAGDAAVAVPLVADLRYRMLNKR
jgi:hypothetical protein